MFVFVFVFVFFVRMEFDRRNPVCGHVSWRQRNNRGNRLCSHVGWKPRNNRGEWSDVRNEKKDGRVSRLFDCGTKNECEKKKKKKKFYLLKRKEQRDRAMISRVEWNDRGKSIARKEEMKCETRSAVKEWGQRQRVGMDAQTRLIFREQFSFLLHFG